MVAQDLDESENRGELVPMLWEGGPGTEGDAGSRTIALVSVLTTSMTWHEAKVLKTYLSSDKNIGRNDD